MTKKNYKKNSKSDKSIDVGTNNYVEQKIAIIINKLHFTNCRYYLCAKIIVSKCIN